MSMVIMLYEFQCYIYFWKNCKILKLSPILTFFEQLNCLKEFKLGTWYQGVCELEEWEIQPTAYDLFEWINFGGGIVEKPCQSHSIGVMCIAVISGVSYICQVKIIWTKYTMYPYMYSWGDCGSLNWKYNCCLYS